MIFWRIVVVDFLVICLVLFLSGGDSDESYREVETVSMDGMLVPSDD